MNAPPKNRVLMLLENNTYPQDGRVRKEAQTLTTAGYRVSVICPRGQNQPWHEQIDGICIYRFPIPEGANGLLGYVCEYGGAMAGAFFLSLFVFLRPGFDIVHAHNPPDTFVCIAAFFKLLGKRFVFDHHDLAPEMYYARFGGRGNRLLYRILLWFEKYSCKLADCVIATNQSYKTIEMTRAGIPETQITIVRNGPDLARLRPVCPTLGQKKSGKTVLCYAGEMGFHDGVDGLLRALYILRNDMGRTDFTCVLVGAGDAWESLKNLTRELDLTDCIRFTGWVAHTEVAHYLSAADIGVAPEPSNAYNDRCTIIKMMEYMAMSKPVVAFDLPEHRITAQEAAVYARPNDERDFATKIALLMDAPKRRQQMGDIGRRRIKNKLAWSHQKKHLLTAYASLHEQHKQTDIASAKNGQPSTSSSAHTSIQRR